VKDSKHIKLLFERYLNNRASREETAELFQYFQDTNNKQALEQMIENQLESQDKEELIDKMILDRVFSKIDLDVEPQKIKSPTWYKITGAAAAIILVISISYYFLTAAHTMIIQLLSSNLVAIKQHLCFLPVKRSYWRILLMEN